MNKFEVLKKYFGYENFREGQETLIDAALEGRDVLGIMPTGAGKSICYQVPALLLPGITVVISPLISLMKDQVQALNQAGVHAAYINSSLTEKQITKALQLAAAGQYKILYVAPERLETYEFKLFAKQVEISMVAVDEAHCISQWGQDFRPSYLSIVQFIRQLRMRPVISAFTATATDAVKEDIVCVLGLVNPQILVTGYDRKNLYFAVETPRKKDAFVLNYVRGHNSDSGVIYCATRKNVDALYEKLLAEGIPVTKYHAGLSNEERKQNQDDFIYDRKPVMVATNAFGMGIDKSNVRYVIHYNMPQSLENYYQEAGRAGRDGEAAECILLYSAQDVVINRFLLDSKEPNPEWNAEDMYAIRERDEKRLRTMTYYCLTQNCLRKYILQYFGEKYTEICGNCSNCLKEFEEIDITKEARLIIACILETGQRYGINVIAGTLLGDDRAKLREYHVSDYSSYASLKEQNEAGIKQMIHQLILEKMLYMTNDKYSLLKVTKEGRALLQDHVTVTLKRAKEEPKPAYETDVLHAGSAKKRKSDILNSQGLALFDVLRALRTELAREEGIPPYLVFSDKTLVDMCVKLPFTEAQMLQVSGVGENKYQKYGNRFMERILDFTGGIKEKLYFGDMAEAVTERERKSAGKKAPKTEFYLTQEQAGNFSYQEKYLAVELAEQMNRLRDAETVKKITGAEIFRFVKAQGLADEKYIDGRWRKVTSIKGIQAGLYIAPRISQKGHEYEDMYFNETAQKMILEHYIKDEATL